MNYETKALGTHLLLELFSCREHVLNDVQFIEETLLEAARRGNATIIQSFFHHFSPYGVSGVVVISESHIAIHTWPEHGFAAIDVFTCGNLLKFDEIESFISQAVGCQTKSVVNLSRGVLPLAHVNSQAHTLSEAPSTVKQTAVKYKKQDVVHQSSSQDVILFSESRMVGEQHTFGITKILASGKTPYQEYSIVETMSYGKMLIIDGYTQSAQADEYMYHEALVHPALCMHIHPEKVLILGAGEGATLRETCKHPSVKRIVTVDIDEEINKDVKEHLTEWHEGAFDDPCVELRFEDGKNYIEEGDERFDVVIIDICDRLPEGPALDLYTKEFYRSVQKRLNPGGILVVQAMELSPLEYEEHRSVSDALKEVFEYVASYSEFIPSFWVTWGFIIASDDVNISTFSQEMIDQIIQERGLDDVLNHYDGMAHVHMFSLSKTLRNVLNPKKVCHQ